MNEHTARLEHLRSQLRTECISLGELIELQSLAGHIEAGDTELLEAAGVPEQEALARTTATNGWISAQNGKWHRAIIPEPTFMRDETTQCGLTFRPLNVTWNGERPPALKMFLCQRPGCI
jgi:hypothetical protein